MENLSLYDFSKYINVYGKRFTHSNTEKIFIIYPVTDAMDKTKSEEYYRQ